MKELGRFDTDLEMFVREPVDPDMNHLRFLRGLAEKGKFGPRPLSVPKGANIFRLRQNELLGYAMEQGDQELNPAAPDMKMRQIQAPRSDFEQQH